MTGPGDVIPSVKPDLPATEDFLGFAPYAQTLFDIVRDENTQTPLTIGIFGSWGSGKTSLMTMIKERLDDLRRQEKRQARQGEIVRSHLPVWFNAWLYSSEESLGRALILRVLAELRREVGRDPEARQALDEMEANLRRSGELASLGDLVIGGQALVSGSGEGAEFRLPLATGLSLLDEIAEARTEAAVKDTDQAAVSALMQTVEQMRMALDRKRVEALEVFRRDFQRLVSRHVSPGFLVVFVDDLDRCLPDKAVGVLEAIKLFFDVAGCIFVLGIDREVIERGIRLKYRDYEQLEGEGPPPISGAKYLEKIVQIPFHLPPIDRAAMEGYIGKMAPRLLELDPRCDDVFTVGMAPNPRRVKRTLNIFLLLWRLSRHLEDLRDRIKPVRLAKMVVIQLHHPHLFYRLPEAPHLLIDLESRFREEKEQRARQDRHRRAAGLEVGEAADQEVTGPLESFLRDRGLDDLLTLHDEGEPDANFADMTPPDVLEYVHLSRSASEAWATREAAPRTFEPQLVHIPAGKFLIGIPEEEVDDLAALFESEDLSADREWLLAQMPQHEVDLFAFYIGRYPVTNAEYAAFVEASEGQVRPPRHWEKGEVPPELASHPVVNITWQDAMAYCDWLSQQMGKKYRLPTEAEWEKAASWDPQAGKKCLYPWGDEWDPARCNNKASPEWGTTPVGQYRQAGGDSPHGLSDMAGNVWEWTLSKWGGDRNEPAFDYPYDRHDGREDLDGTEFRVLRGGSFHDGAGWCRTSARYPQELTLAADYIGFRVVIAVREEATDGTP
jgi:formylglycine-generating enzyme required for sulfatase activity/predicted nucleic acid-binding protein